MGNHGILRDYYSLYVTQLIKPLGKLQFRIPCCRIALLHDGIHEIVDFSKYVFRCNILGHVSNLWTKIALHELEEHSCMQHRVFVGPLKVLAFIEVHF